MNETRPSLGDEILALSFEKALQELEDIVARLERGDAALEDSIALYQRGAALRAHCEDKLQKAQLQVEKITQRSDGVLESQPFFADKAEDKTD